MCEGDAADELVHSLFGIGDERIRRHDMADHDAAEQGAEPGMLLFGCRGVDHEQPDQYEPQPGEARTVGDLKESEADQDVAEDAPGATCGEGRALLVSPDHPQYGAQHSSSVEGCRGDEVEDGQHDVDSSEVAEDGDGQAAPAGEREADRQGAVDDAQGQTCQWSHRRDAQIGARRTGISLEFGDATEQPEPDALDLDSVAASEDRVCHLVGEHRGQEQDGRGHRGSQVGDGASAG